MSDCRDLQGMPELDDRQFVEGRPLCHVLVFRFRSFLRHYDPELDACLHSLSDVSPKEN